MGGERGSPNDGCDGVSSEALRSHGESLWEHSPESLQALYLAHSGVRVERCAHNIELPDIDLRMGARDLGSTSRDARVVPVLAFSANNARWTLSDVDDDVVPRGRCASARVACGHWSLGSGRSGWLPQRGLPACTPGGTTLSGVWVAGGAGHVRLR